MHHTTWRAMESRRIDAHAAAACQEIQRMAQKARGEINKTTRFIARSLGQKRRYSNNNGGKMK